VEAAEGEKCLLGLRAAARSPRVYMFRENIPATRWEISICARDMNSVIGLMWMTCAFDTCVIYVICVICSDARAVCAVRAYTRWHKCNFHITSHKFMYLGYIFCQKFIRTISDIRIQTNTPTQISPIMRTVITSVAKSLYECKVTNFADAFHNQCFLVHVDQRQREWESNLPRINLKLVANEKSRKFYESYIINAFRLASRFSKLSNLAKVWRLSYIFQYGN